LLLTGSFGVPAAQAGIGYALFSVAMAFGRLTGDRVVKRLGQRRVLLYGGLMVTAGFALLLVLPMRMGGLGWVSSHRSGGCKSGPHPLQYRRPAGRDVTGSCDRFDDYAGLCRDSHRARSHRVHRLPATSLRAAFAVLAVMMLGFPVFRGRIPTAV
jgi:hypothetical protein